MENVWNNFLLSPLEMARFIDEMDNPAVGAYFDIGYTSGWATAEVPGGDRKRLADIAARMNKVLQL